jgi:IS605 OrfB family transposase
MKLTLQIQLLPDKEQDAKLQTTVRRFNQAASWLAKKAFERKLANKVALQKLFYAELRVLFGLSSQMAVRCIAQVVEAYKRDKSKCPTFRPFAAMPYDQRIMRFKGLDRVSLLTLDGRIMVPVIMGQYQRGRFTPAVGQSDLVRRKDGKWFLLMVVDVPDGTPIPTTDFIGVDLGAANIATTDDGTRFSGGPTERTRQKYQGHRRSLQKAAAHSLRRGKRPKQIRRALVRASKKESRFRRDVNHVISKRLVAKAKDTGYGIALENLKGIRDRTRFRKPQRARMSGWAFSQLHLFVEYKAKLSGVPAVTVDPCYTSQTCSACGHCEKANRPAQDTFLCQVCGFSLHADINAARNIRARALVNAPQVSESSPALGGRDSRDKLTALAVSG